MDSFFANQKKSRQLAMGLTLACFLFGFAVGTAAADGGASQKPAASTTQAGGDLSTDNLQKEISSLDRQIQTLREQSLALQEKTRAKLQAQLEFLKKERDTLVPRIEKLRDNSEVAWQDIKENIQKVIEDLNTSVDSIK